MIRKLLPILAMFAVLMSACGAPPDEPIADTQAALNGHSVPPNPLGSWPTTPPAGCLHFWDPMNSTWPAHGFCPWQPVAANQDPWGVGNCAGAAPSVPGTMWLYSGPNYTGSCAAIYATGYPGYQYDSDLVQTYGWLSIWTQPFTGRQMQVNIQSIRVAPSTNVGLCEGPFTGPGSTCQLYRQIGISTATGGQGVNYPSVTYPDGSPFTIAAIQLGTY